MKKYLALFMMSMLCLLSFHASGQTVRTVTFIIDNHNAITLRDANYQTVSLSDGTNTVTLPATQYGANFTVTCNDGYKIESVTENGSSQYCDGSSYYGSTGQMDNVTYTITTSGGGATVTQYTVNINIDDPNAVLVYNSSRENAWNSQALSLTSGDNAVQFNSTDNTFYIKSGETQLPSVTYNGSPVSYMEHYGYEITGVADNSTIKIVAEDPNAVKYHVSFASGSNTAAISRIMVQGSYISDYQSGFYVKPGDFFTIYFDDVNYDVSDLSVNGTATELSYGSLYVSDVQEDQVVSFTATPKATQTVNTVTFNINGPTTGLVINRGSSEWDTALKLSTNFTDNFEGDTQQYWIKANDNYQITQITKNSQPVTVLSYGTTIDVENGDVVYVTVEDHNPATLRTATLTVNLSSLQYFKESIFINSGALDYGDVLSAEGQKTYQFNPNDTNEKTFRITCNEDLYSVQRVRGGSTTNINKSNGAYTVTAQDGDVVNIVARDPNAPAPAQTTANLVFTNAANGLNCLVINGENRTLTGDTFSFSYDADETPNVTLQTKSNTYVNPHVYYLPIVTGLPDYNEMTEDNWDAYWNARVHQYEYELDKNNADPVVSALSTTENDDIDSYYNKVPFGHTKEALYSLTSFSFPLSVTNSGDNINITLKEYTFQLNYNRKVNFTVNIPDAITIQDVTEPSTPVDITVSNSFQYTFNAAYPNAKISVKPGYKFKTVTVTNGNNESEQTPSDKYVNLSLGNNYTVAIVVEVDENTVVTGTATIRVVGPTNLVRVYDVATSSDLTLNSGDNEIDITGTNNQYYVMATGGLSKFYDITLNGKTQTTSGSYYEIALEGNDLLVIYTKEKPTFTVKIVGDMDKISSLTDQDNDYDIEEGVNTIDIPVEGKEYSLCLANGKDPLYCVKLNGKAITPEKEQRGSKNYYYYDFTPEAGDVLSIITDGEDTTVEGCVVNNFTNDSYASGATVTWATTYGVEFATTATGSTLPTCAGNNLNITNGGVITVAAPHGYGFSQIKLNKTTSGDLSVKINNTSCTFDDNVATYTSANNELPTTVTIEGNNADVTINKIEFVLDVTGVEDQANDFPTILGELNDEHPANYIDAYGNANKIIVSDAGDFTLAKEVSSKEITYNRTIKSSSLNSYKWQALYVPFDMPESEWSKFANKVIKFSSVTGSGEDIQLVFDVVTSDLTANELYLFNPIGNVEIDMTSESGDLKIKAEPKSDSYTYLGKKYTLTGTYTTKTDMYSTGAYALSGGNFCQAESDEVVLKPFRVFLTITDMKSNAPASPKTMRVRVQGDDTAEIESIETDSVDAADDVYYNLLGEPVTNPAPGFYIHNGQKVYIK